MESNMDVIQAGDVIIIQRQNYMKTHKLNNLSDKKSSLVQLGRDSLDISPIIGQPYGSCFKMILSESSSKKKKLYNLEFTESVENFEEMFLDDESGGTDNRNLFDAAAFTLNPDDVQCSQKLSKDDIESMREQGVEGSKIIGELIENSASFSQKTRFSQEKFVRKKSKKYFPYVMIRRPSIRLLAEIYYANDPMKIMNMRIDSLAQMLNNANVRAGANYMVYETGCQGLVVSAVMDRLVGRGDSGPEGKLVHIFQTGTPQTQALASMNFSEEVIAQHVTSLNIYHLRSLENGVDLFKRNNPNKMEVEEEEADKPDQSGDNSESVAAKPPHRQKLREESQASFELLKQKNMDGLLIACKQHPTNLLLSLMKYLAPSRPFVVYSPYKEPLMDTYMAVKDSGKAVMVMLTETWMRNYQVLPARTHPEVMMSGGGGYLLTGIFVDNTEPERSTENGQVKFEKKNQGRKRQRN